ncbi:hypothetical protein NQ315_005011 [Exocentrus adspersus]|uniref:RING-type domain-containing protein n=1 Tax=Exocentrus adspersus TaxID=1586481 RepID=A0AAV8VRF3_9CUCU|nr:hypothetical protein NQ315_005011 [Exocentrus adspersus]
MDISCIICRDLFIPTSKVYISQCGHMFHFQCLVVWIERSKTCPQCRRKCTEETIHRVYFNLTNTEGVAEDAGTLQNKLENVQFEMQLKDNDIKLYTHKYKKAKHQVDGLREEVTKLESKIREYESSIHALKDQISYFKSKARESEKLSEEVVKLKNSIKDMENVQLAVNGTREQVNDILKNERNIESLALLVATLKKTLLDAERKKRDMEYNLKKAQNDATRYRREVTALECQNNDLRKEIEYSKENLEKEKQYLKTKIIELQKQISTATLDVADSSLKRIVAESPINFNRKPRLSLAKGLPDTSPSMTEKVQKILDSDSPYLPVKSSNVAIDYTSILNTKTRIGSSKNGFSIFKPATVTLENIKQTKSNSDVVYNGLGSSSKEDVFPSPKPPQTGLKRHKSSSSISSNKFKKLAPGSTKSRLPNYFNQGSSTQ